MQITVTISDEIVAQVQARGLTPENYVESLIAERAQSLDRAGELSLEDFSKSLDALARYSDKIPVIPIEALSRESFYENHD